MRKIIIANTLGLAILALLTIIFSFFIPDAKISKGLWIFIYITWAACSMYFWNHEKSPKKYADWLKIALLSPVAAMAWFFISRMISKIIFGSNDPFLSKVIDFGITLMLSPGITFLAFSGWVRGAFLRNEID